MIVRLQCYDRQKLRIIHSWCLFNVEDELIPVGTFFERIYDGKISCGRGLKLAAYDRENVLASVYSGHKKNPSVSDLMPAPLSIKMADLKENNCALFVQFECDLKPVVDEAVVEVANTEADGSSSSTIQDEPLELDAITNVLMNKNNHYVSPTPNEKYGNNKQYNEIVKFVKQRKFGVSARVLLDFEDFL